MSIRKNINFNNSSSTWNHKLPKALVQFIKNMPKTALHIHIEGSLEPEMAWNLAISKKPPFGSNRPLQIPAPPGTKPDPSGPNIKNGKYQVTTLIELKKVYNFTDLESFLNVYNTLATLLDDESDFEALAAAYGAKCLEENIRHAEVFFDPQTHISRQIPFKTVVTGLQKGFQTARDKGINIELISSILRDHKVGTPGDSGDITSNKYTVDTATAWVVAHCTVAWNALTGLPGGSPGEVNPAWKITGVGLDNNELGFPPELFTGPYAYLRKNGLFGVAHAGEEGPPAYIWEAINKLKCIRIDHGVQSIKDPNLLAYMQSKHNNSQSIAAWGSPWPIPITVCPLSNYKLKVFADPTTTNIIDLLDIGLTATVNSDDPAYFGGYVTENYLFLLKALSPTVAKERPVNLADIFRLAKNGFNAKCD